jgi:hypothetical protein
MEPVNDAVALLQREAAAGFPHLAGTRLTGTLPVGEGLLNEAVRRLPGAPTGLVVEVLAANRLAARYGIVRATAILEEDVRVGDGPPQVSFQLASTLIAWTLKQALRSAAVRIDGRRVTVDIGALPGMDRYRPHWPHLRRVRLRTTAGHVQIDFEVGVG